MAMPKLPQAPGDEESRRLRSALDAGCSTPGEIVEACGRVESAARNAPRVFFRHCFPSLLRCVFGFFEGAPSPALPPPQSWFATLAQPGNEAASNVLVSLLSPGGTLIRSMLAADKESVVRYVFPYERLPDWVRRLLAVDGGVAILEHVSVLYRGRVKEENSGVQIELDIFQYYVFWFAYYALSRDAGGTLLNRVKRPGTLISRSRTQIENWIPAALHSPASQPSQSQPQPQQQITPLHPYLQLLHLYLSHFVGPEMFRREKLQLWQQAEEDRVSHADVFLRTLIDFWLVADDPCPFRLSLSYIAPPPASLYAPPATDVTDAVKLLVNYFSAILQIHMGDHHHSAPLFDYRRKYTSDYVVRQRSPTAAVSVSPYMQALQRPLYRFFLQAMCFWPVSSSLTRLLPLLEVWQNYMEPWTAILLVSNDSNLQPGSSVSLDESGRGYSAYWQGYVLSNYHFYTTLVFHFLEFALKFLHVDVELTFATTSKVLNVLSRSTDLIDLLQRVEAAYTEHLSGMHHSPFADRIPAIQEQLKDWEDGIPQIEQDHGELSVLGRATRLHFFHGPGRTGYDMLQAMISQAEAENRERPAVSSKTLESLKMQARRIFNQEMVTTNCSPSKVQALDSVVVAGDPSRSLGLQRHTWAEVRYKGDWMRRPIESHEIAWLVRLLVKLSDRINDAVGLVHGDDDESRNKEEEDGIVRRGLAELLGRFKKWGFRVNLRPLADVKTMAFLAVVLFVHWVAIKIAGLLF